VREESKITLYRLDFLLRQRLDQFIAIFGDNSSYKNGKLDLISDTQGRLFWTKYIGEKMLFSPWKKLITSLATHLELTIPEQTERDISTYLDFTRDGIVSVYEFSTFLKWFGPLHGCITRLTEPLEAGLLCGFVPSIEAAKLLQDKTIGSYLIRFSKTEPSAFAVTFVDSSNRIKHSLLHHVAPAGMTLKRPPDIYRSLKEFVGSHCQKLKFPVGTKWVSELIVARNGDTLITSDDDEDPEVILRKDDTNMCVVCLDKRVDTVFLECGHLACCKKCAIKLQTCPICRSPITRVVPIFIP